MWAVAGVPHTSCPIIPGVSPSSVPTVGTSPPGCRYTAMLQLPQDRGPWFPGHGVVQTQQNMGVHSGHAEGLPQ